MIQHHLAIERFEALAEETLGADALVYYGPPPPAPDPKGRGAFLGKRGGERAQNREARKTARLVRRMPDGTEALIPILPRHPLWAVLAADLPLSKQRPPTGQPRGRPRTGRLTAQRLRALRQRYSHLSLTELAKHFDIARATLYRLK